MMAAGDGQHDEGSVGGTAAPAPEPVHVLVFPLPLQGHMTPMLKLAELLSVAGIRVTFLNSDHNHRRLLRSASVGDRLSRRPGLRLMSIPDGLPDDHPRNASGTREIVEAFNTTAPSLFRRLLASGAAEAHGFPPVTCIVADGLIGFAVDVAGELNIPVVAFRTSGACSFWAYYRIPDLIASRKIPFQDGCDLDELVGCVPGMETFLRRRDLPSFCRAKDVQDHAMTFLKWATQNTTRFRGLVFNTADFAESTPLTHIRAHLPSTYPIGPLHGLLQSVDSTGGGRDQASPNSTSLWPEERACIEWLDARPPASVVYVSFGSLTLLSRDQLLQFWHGLVDSGYGFLWVVRPGLVRGEEGSGGVPEAVAEATQERGFLVGWAPQQEVLAHPAVGCFLTHSGWNSTLESIWAGLPMVCWPFFADQQINSRFVSEVWKIGLDIKDTCDRFTVEKAVREVMAGTASTKMREAAAGMAKMMRESVAEGGSSYRNLQRLIRDIRSLSLERHEYNQWANGAAEGKL